mgnify:CR=1 FL=1
MTYFIEIMLNEETGAYHDALGASAEGYTPGCGPADDQIEEDGAYHDALMRYRP